MSRPPPRHFLGYHGLLGGAGPLILGVNRRGNPMGEVAEFRWATDEVECAAVARSLFINACVGTARYWQSYGTDFVTRSQPEEPFIRPWSEIASAVRYSAQYATWISFHTVKPRSSFGTE